MSRTSLAERLAAAGGLVLLIGLFLKWYGVASTISVNGVDLHPNISASANGWHTVTDGRILFLITALLAIALAVAKATGRTLNFPITPSVLLAGLAGLSVLWIVLRLLIHPGDYLSVKFGIFIALIGAAMITFGAVRNMQENGASFAELRQHADRVTRPDA